MRFLIITIVLFTFFFSCQQKTNATYTEMEVVDTGNKNVFFKNINEGDTLSNPFVVEMGVSGMRIKPAGQLEAGTGHHHIILNKSFMKYGEIIPMDEQHLHYGKGDTVVTLSLPSGSHQLTLQFANGMHMSYGEQFSNTINVYVK